MSERMIECVARAIDVLMEDGGPVTSEAIACAAIEAMREPTDAMVDAANSRVRPDSDNLQCPDWYSAAIDAALNEQVSG